MNWREGKFQSTEKKVKRALSTGIIQGSFSARTCEHALKRDVVLWAESLDFPPLTFLSGESALAVCRHVETFSLVGIEHVEFLIILRIFEKIFINL